MRHVADVRIGDRLRLIEGEVEVTGIRRMDVRSDLPPWRFIVVFGNGAPGIVRREGGALVEVLPE